MSESSLASAMGSGAMRYPGAYLQYLYQTAGYGFDKVDSAGDAAVQIGVNAARTTILGIMKAGSALIHSFTGQRETIVQANGVIDHTSSAIAGGIHALGDKSRNLFQRILAAGWKLGADTVDGVVEDAVQAPYVLKSV